MVAKLETYYKLRATNYKNEPTHVAKALDHNSLFKLAKWLWMTQNANAQAFNISLHGSCQHN